MVGQSKFSHKELHGKSCDAIQEMLWSTYNLNWNDIQTHKKRGTCVYKKLKHEGAMYGDPKELIGQEGARITYIDQDIPVFTQDRNFIDKHVHVGE
jgi:tRNA(His) 5'-end guanylyltransferase